MLVLIMETLFSNGIGCNLQYTFNATRLANMNAKSTSPYISRIHSLGSLMENLLNNYMIKSNKCAYHNKNKF